MNRCDTRSYLSTQLTEPLPEGLRHPERSSDLLLLRRRYMLFRPAIGQRLLTSRVHAQLRNEVVDRVATHLVQLEPDPKLDQLRPNLLVLLHEPLDLPRILLRERRQHMLLLERHVAAQAVLEHGPKAGNVYSRIHLERVGQSVEDSIELPVIPRELLEQPF
jgi:hypothetical protein